MLKEHLLSPKTPIIVLFLSILEYAVAVWCPYWKKDIDKLERVQRQFTKRIKGMKDLTYSGRLSKLKLPSLMYRRIRGDMVEVYKILNNYVDPLTT